jgi:hypothetical protein
VEFLVVWREEEKSIAEAVEARRTKKLCNLFN